MATVLKINGTAYAPKTIAVNVADVDYESGRNQQGKMVRDRRRGGKSAVRTIQVTFPPLSPKEMSNLLKDMGASKFSVYYPDPYLGDYRTAQCYAGDRSVPMWTMIKGKWQWESMTVNLIEF